MHTLPQQSLHVTSVQPANTTTYPSTVTNTTIISSRPGDPIPLTLASSYHQCQPNTFLTLISKTINLPRSPTQLNFSITTMATAINRQQTHPFGDTLNSTTDGSLISATVNYILPINFTRNSLIPPSHMEQPHWQSHLARSLLQTRADCQVPHTKIHRNRLFGKNYSSDSEGDGPKTKVPRSISEPSSSKSKRARIKFREETDEDFIPEIGQRIYVDLETFNSDYYLFPMLTGERQDYSMVGRYDAIYWTDGLLSKATIQFFYPENHPWTLDSNWIRQFGWRTERQQGRTVLNRFLMKTPTEEVVHPAFILNSVVNEAPEHQTYTHLDHLLQQELRQFPPHRSGNLGIGVININGYVTRKTPYIGWIMKRANIGCFGVVDTRIKQTSYKVIRRNWEEFHPGGQVQFFKGALNIGGTSVFLDSEWAPRMRDTWSDPSGLGIINEITFHSEEGIIRVLIIYWPFQSENMDDNNNSLVTHLRRWLLLSNRDITPDAYIKLSIEARRRKGGTIILAGDLNTREHSLRYLWLQDIGLEDVHGNPPEPFFTRFSGLKPTGRIDFIFSSISAQNYGWSESAQFDELSDHRPIWAHFQIAGPRSKRILTQQSTISLKPNYRNLEMLDKVVKAIMRELCQIQEGNEPDRLRSLNDVIVKEFRIKKTIKGRQYWSPTMMARNYWLAMGNALTRQRASKWPSTVRYYSEKAHAIGNEGSSEWQSLETEFSGFLRFSATKFADMISEVKRTLHAKHREQERLQIMEATQKREKDPKIIFRSLGKTRPQVNLDRLITPLAIITDPATIHAEMTNIFELWLDNPTQGPEHRDLWTALEGRTSAEQIQLLEATFADKMVPLTFIQLFHQALFSTNGKRELVEQELTPLIHGPTLIQFREELQGASSTSAGGPSGLTYGMLKHTPDAAIVFIYDQLCEAWQRGESLPWLRKKILCPIPKPGLESNPSAYRPIMLLEVVRKTWVGALVRVIRRTWDKHSILCDSQHGFRAGRSTLAPLIQVINSLEGAMEEDIPLYVSSWDIRRAFDSPPPPMDN